MNLIHKFQQPQEGVNCETFQTFLWSLQFVVQNKSWARYNRSLKLDWKLKYLELILLVSKKRWCLWLQVDSSKECHETPQVIGRDWIGIASCRHCVGQKALNMFLGELCGYPLFIMKNFKVNQNVKFCFANVMCQLCKFVLQNEPKVAAPVKPALSHV